MTAAKIQFFCSKCEQLLECEAEFAGQDTTCPLCQQCTRIPIQPPPIPRPRIQADAPSQPIPRPHSRLQKVALAGLVGAGLGFQLGLGLGVAFVGALVGFLVGRRITTIQSPYGGRIEVAKPTFPFARVGLLLSVGAWVLVILVWAWLVTRPPETFHDQGGMVFTFVVLPLYLGCWVLGGPAALALSYQGMKQIRAGTRAKSGRWMARTGIALSCIMILAGIVLLVSWLLIEFSR